MADDKVNDVKIRTTRGWASLKGPAGKVPGSGRRISTGWRTGSPLKAPTLQTGRIRKCLVHRSTSTSAKMPAML